MSVGIYGSGDGDGSGGEYGDGYGDGSGDGYGDEDGSGDGSGDGIGSGDERIWLQFAFWLNSACVQVECKLRARRPISELFLVCTCAKANHFSRRWWILGGFCSIFAL